MFESSESVQKIGLEGVSNNLSKGILFVITGSSSYGMLSTVVKFSYHDHYSTAEITMAQYFLGLLCLFILNLFAKKDGVKESFKDIGQLMFAGIFVGLTSFFYYACVKYIDASIAVVLLMQSVWIGVVIEMFQKRRLPELNKILAVVFILFGTVLATNLINATKISLDIRGVVLGFLAAISFSLTLLSANTIATHLPSVKRSMYMLVGGAIIMTIFCTIIQTLPYNFGINLINEQFITAKAFDWSIFYKWGILVSLFGTVIPPVMLNKGFPIVGVGLGSILASMELPFALIIAFTFLNEKIVATQWMGVAIILGSIVLMNYKMLTNRSTN
ncbi:DMT family transporter [Bdellovibrio sp. NC01]|uniref:EamA family transporter n=1 Tax=Bdellovibrio sp. NC01 TaxID=2220073 RepID=UPI00115BB8C3|nr:EamA family transporter [Bdellovibrio sp. NC01]QDK38455.1 EamA/RhaT family transporter [Bdellovibrio sp. NC01]